MRKGGNEAAANRDRRFRDLYLGGTRSEYYGDLSFLCFSLLFCFFTSSLLVGLVAFSVLGCSFGREKRKSEGPEKRGSEELKRQENEEDTKRGSEEEERK